MLLPAAAPRPDRWRKPLGLASLVLLPLALVLGLLVAPPDAVQGNWQRMMYLHVPAAWTAYLSFTVVLACSIGYLRTKRPVWDLRAMAAAEIGVLATGLTLLLGSIWGHAAWGVWWAWDPRLTATLVLFLIYVGYLGLRGVGRDPARAARRAAVLGIVGFLDLPIVHFSVLWWRTLHQQPTFLDPRHLPPPIDPRMAAALAVSVVVVTTAAAWLFLRRVDGLTAAAVDPAHVPQPRRVPEPAAAGRRTR